MSEASPDRRALYLRWRPRGFSDVVGQEHVVRTLRNAVATQTPAHAYLFAGPRGTGKTSLARILFRAVNCAEPQEGEPCGACHACETALEGRSLDLVEIDAASNRGIDDIRELREKVAFSPSEMRYRVYIVDEAHELTAAAWDAFLKTLEEPPPHAIFVLATTEAQRVPGTIVSRCQRFDFRRIKPETIKDRLGEIAEHEGLQLEPAAAERLARMARGGLRDAISLLDQAASFTAGRVDLEALREVLGLTDLRTVQRLIEAVARRDAREALELLAQLSESGADLRLFADELAAQLRGLLFAAAGASRALVGELSSDELSWLETQAALRDPAALEWLLRGIMDGLTRIRDSGQFQLHLELAVLQACAASPAGADRPSNRLSPEGSTSSPRGPEAVSRAHQPGASVDPGLPDGPPPPSRSSRPPESAAERPAIEPARAAPSPTAATSSPTSGRPASSDLALVTAPLSLEAVRRDWPRVIQWVEERNSFVASYLRPAELRHLEQDHLVLSFAFKVHHERVAEQKNRMLVEEACEQIFGRSLRLRCEHVRATGEADVHTLDVDDPVLKFALERFGGRAELLEG